MLKTKHQNSFPAKILLVTVLLLSSTALAQLKITLGTEIAHSFQERQEDRCSILYYGPSIEAGLPDKSSRFHFFGQTGFAWLSPRWGEKQTLIPLLAGADLRMFKEKESGVTAAAGFNYFTGPAHFGFQYKAGFFHTLTFFGSKLQQRFGFMSIAGDHYYFIQLNLFGFPVGR